MTLDDDIKLVVRSLFVGMRKVLVEPVSGEWVVRGERIGTKRIIIKIEYPK